MQYVPIERTPIELKVLPKDFNEVIKKRIAGFIRKKASFICFDMLNTSKGARHQQIYRCIDVLEYLHYLPEIESEIIQTLTNGITQMYGSENEAKKCNAYKSFNALNVVPRNCDIIQEIIDAETEKQRIETERIANNSKTFAIWVTKY